MFVRGRDDFIGWDAIQLFSDSFLFFSFFFFVRIYRGTDEGRDRVSGPIRRREKEKGGLPASRRMRRYRELERTNTRGTRVLD